MFRRLEGRKSLSCSSLFMNLFLGQSYNTIMPAFALAFQTAPFPPLDFLIDLIGGGGILVALFVFRVIMTENKESPFRRRE